MNPKRTIVLGLLAALALALAPEVPAASGAKHFAGGHGGSYRPGGHWGFRPGNGHHYGGWGWGLGWGLALGIPLAYALHDPYWGPAYYPSYAYGPAYRGPGEGCGDDEECWRARVAPAEPQAPTTQVPAPAAGEGPSQRPLHLNYCDAARAWYPQVRTCPSGWRLIRPEYN